MTGGPQGARPVRRHLLTRLRRAPSSPLTVAFLSFATTVALILTQPGVALA